VIAVQNGGSHLTAVARAVAGESPSQGWAAPCFNGDCSCPAGTVRQELGHQCSFSQCPGDAAGAGDWCVVGGQLLGQNINETLFDCALVHIGCWVWQ